MKATRHNGRSGKHGTYDAKHNDRRFDVENSEHIDAERTKFNVYWETANDKGTSFYYPRSFFVEKKSVVDDDIYISSQESIEVTVKNRIIAL